MVKGKLGIGQRHYTRMYLCGLRKRRKLPKIVRENIVGRLIRQHVPISSSPESVSKCATNGEIRGERTNSPSTMQCIRKAVRVCAELVSWRVRPNSQWRVCNTANTPLQDRMSCQKCRRLAMAWNYSEWAVEGGGNRG